MLRKLYKRNCSCKVRVIDDTNLYYSSEQVLKDDSVVNVSVVKQSSVSKDYAKFSYRDFNLSALLSVGAYKESAVLMSENGMFNIVDSVASLPVKTS